MNRWLNYHQLLYFRAVARTGSLAAASAELRLAPQTLSEHVQQLEASLGLTLFDRGSRGMTLTETGRLALVFAEEIHALGQELFATLDGGGARGPARLVVGVDEALPRLVTWALLKPAVTALAGAPLICRDGSHAALLDLLRSRVVDVVLSGSDEVPEGAEALRRVLLCESPVSWVAASPLAERLREGFPASLNDAPVVLPAAGSALRRALDRWCERAGVRPRAVAEMSDSALAKTACADGLGAIALPTSALASARRRYGLRLVGRCEGVTQRAFAYASQRLRPHPGVDALMEPGPDAPLA